MIRIVKELCIGCGLCARACPFSAINIKDGKAVLNDKCVGCGSCADECRKNAIESDRMPSEKEKTEGSGIWVFAQTYGGRPKQVAFELIGCAGKIAKEMGYGVTAIACGDSDGLASELISSGADEVILLPDCPEENDAMAADAFEQLINERHPDILLIGATVFGRSLAPRIAAKVNTGLTADCTQLEIDKETGLLTQIRPAFGGNLMAAIVCPDARPQMATVRPKVFPLPEKDSGRTGKIERVRTGFSEKTLIKLVQMLKEDENEVNISDAQVLVSVGKGIGSKKNIALAEKLAKLLGGAVSGTRAVMDAGWLPYSRQVGQTGKTVSPKIYIACGISGAIQHVVGLAGVETVIAINKDAEAPIFKSADIGIVGDCLEVIPAIIEELEGKNKKDPS